MKYIFLAIFIYSRIILSAYGQNGLHFEYKVSHKGKNETTGIFTVNSLNGNSISELKNLQYPTHPITTLCLKDDPDFGYSINPDMTYIKMKDKQLSEYKVELLGKENINGFHCTKVAVYTHSGEDYSVLWVSDEIPSYKKYLTATVNNFNLTKLNYALKKINLAGLPVRISYNESSSLQYDLVKVAFVSFDNSMFSLDKYREAKMQPASNDQLQQMFSIAKTSANITIGIFSKEKREPIPFSSIRIYRNGKQTEIYQTDNKGYSNFGLSYTNETITIEARNLEYKTRDTILSIKPGNYNIKLYLETNKGNIESTK